ncbi:Hypothetical predicted protein [Mytilus galloprovincialis]|uniref:Uncharacterized protein n=1 Tax=Mytilus galloprovincialis TaxID=29158 RepID=A0A8B6FPU2_MYTGA|nr:Hypothetical predicted protein [Mytilus galloprovincialis]
MISIEDYRQIENISVNLNCEIHGKKLETRYCSMCSPLEHKSCSSSDVISIDEAANNAKQSSALLDLEGTISATIDNVKHCISDREMALKNVDQDEKQYKH